MELHHTLSRQLKSLKLNLETPPESTEEWQAFLKTITQTYTENDKERYRIERSLNISSEEMRELYESLQFSEQQAQDEHYKFESVIASISDGICILDFNGRLTYINPAAEQLAGWTMEDTKDQKMYQLVRPDKPEEMEYPDAVEIVRSIKTKGFFRHDDGVLRCKDGTFLPISYIVSPFYTNGKLSGFVWVFRDIRERKSFEKLRHARDVANESNRAKGLFLANMSHELRTSTQFYYWL